MPNYGERKEEREEERQTGFDHRTSREERDEKNRKAGRPGTRQGCPPVHPPREQSKGRGFQRRELEKLSTECETSMASYELKWGRCWSGVET